MRFPALWIFSLAGFSLAGCATRPPPTPSSNAAGFNQPGLNPATDWKRLDPWQGARTQAEWQEALAQRFAPHNANKDFISVTPETLWARMRQADPAHNYELLNRLPNAPRPVPPPGARFWRTRDELGPATPEHPLAGLRVALDPGHLGGQWAEMEARSFSVDGRPPVREGDLALRVAQVLKPRLEALGAQVSLVRDHAGPVTTDTPASLRPVAESEWLASAAAKYGQVPPPGDPRREHDIQKLAETQFYRVSEIQARARRVNHELRPDLVLCLHFDAAEWPNPQKPALVPQQHFHILVNGAYSAAELANDEDRLDLLERVASGADEEELAAARTMAEAAAPIFGLPAFGYSGPNGVALGGNGYVWGRNLLTNRLYRCPVVFLEPYVANSVEGYERIQAGEYSGMRVFGGRERKNIIAEYADAVVAGLVRYYGAR